jgi:RNA polymerase sigma factor (TIGR02999 family)
LHRSASRVVLLDGPLPFQHDAGVCRFYKFFDSSGHEGRMEKWNRLVVAAPHLSPEMPAGKVGEGNLRLLVPREASPSKAGRAAVGCLRKRIGSAAMNEAARILTAIENGDPQAAEQLLPLVYDELRRLAARQLTRESTGQTLQATALVHEAYLRLVGPEPDRLWDGRGHFFAAAAQAMRHILVDAARRKSRKKRGGEQRRVELDDHPAPDPDEDLLALDDALKRLACEDPVAAKVIELRHFAGLGHEQVAAALGITVYLARQKWTYARAWLGDVLRG